MSVVKGKVVKAKAKFQQPGTKAKNNKFNENQKNKQSPSKAMRDKIKNGVQAENFSDSVVFSPKITKKMTSKQQKPSPKTEPIHKTSNKKEGFVKTSGDAVNVNKKFTGNKPKTGPFAAPEKGPAPQAQNLKGITKQKHTGVTKDFGKKGQTMKSAKRRERREKNLTNESYNQKLQNAFWEADTNKTERSLMERNSKKYNIKNIKQTPVSVGSDESDQSDYEVEHVVKADKIAKKLSTKEKSDSEDEESDEVMGSDIAEDEEMESDNAEDEEVESDDSEDDEEMGSDVDDEEIGSDAEDEEMGSDVEDEAEIESDSGDVDKSGNELESEDMIPLTLPKKDDHKKKLNLLDKVKGKESTKKAKKEDSNQGQADEQKKASRYVLFVGNLNFNLDEPTIREHFKKAGEVRDIRIMTEKGTNKPRGFAFVELSDSEGYQKALSLHHSMLSGRRINVERATGHTKDPQMKKKEVAKNLKLYAMRKKGMLAGSNKPKDNRNARKNKAKAMSKGTPEKK